MSDTTPRAWHLYIQDMIAFAERVLAYTHGMDQETFTASALTRDATLRNLELIGEAAGRIPSDVRDQHPGIPWRKIVATRNQLVHAYLGIDDDIVWSLIRDDVPLLLEQLRTIVASTD